MNAPKSKSPADVPADATEPDVLLDVSELKVDEISLDVEDLRARVSLQADVLQLLKLHAGVEAELGKVELTIKGVEAKLLLQVRLNNVARIIERVLTTIDNNPSIVESVVQAADEAVAGAARAVPPVLSTVSERKPARVPRLSPSADSTDEDAPARPAKRSRASRAAKRSRASRARRSEED